ncbi:MAG: methyltransferase domain-containing protein [Bryobacteraceae bacterium]
MSDFKYVGCELDLFATVRNWKSYWASQVQPFVRGDVLEVGAGIGANTPIIDRGPRGRWLRLEPDPLLFSRLPQTAGYEDMQGTLQDLERRGQFDTILYIDVLEHIEDDRAELQEAAARLRQGGRLIVLAPAHQFLFSPFDASIGHFRRYNRTLLKKIGPVNLRLERLHYLDSAGLAVSVANRLLLRQSLPSGGQLRFWDQYLIPLSRVIDKCTARCVGKTIFAVWQREKG